MGPFGSLPDELILAILASTEEGKVVARFGMASHRMRALTSDDSLWRTLCAGQDGPPVPQRFAEFGKDWKWVYRARLPTARRGRIRSGSVGTTASVMVTYTGDFHKRRRHGYGRVCREGGVIYDGQWHRGKRHGRGLYAWSERSPYEDMLPALPPIPPRYRPYSIGSYRLDCCGGSYDGEWANDRRCGDGVCLWESGASYRGALADDKFHGEGAYTWPNGSRYEGAWWLGIRHGQGALALAGGDRYEGQWHRGKMSGQGTYVWSHSADAQSKAEPDGRGTVSHGGGEMVYAGQWSNSMRHGQGTHTWSDGCAYSGGWFGDKRQGSGAVTYADGHVYDGLWTADCFQGLGMHVLPDGGKRVCHRVGNVWHDLWACDKYGGRQVLDKGDECDRVDARFGSGVFS